MADAVEAASPASAEASENVSEADVRTEAPKAAEEVNGGSVAAAERSLSAKGGETLGLVVDAGEDGDLLVSGGSPDVDESEGHSLDGEDGEGNEEPEERLARADQLFEKGSKAIEGGDFVEAVDCLSRALEIRVEHFGELAPECVSSYYKYGCALLYKAQEESDPFVNVPKDSANNSAKDTAVETGESSSGSKILVADSALDHSITKKEKNGEHGMNGSSVLEMADGAEGSGDDEEVADADEDDSDLDLAWKMLDIARAIVEKCQEDTLEKVNILSALGEVAVEREDIETSLNDYQKALSILGNLVESNHRRIIELNFRICLVLELGSKIEEAIPYCKKASELCESRLQQLKEELAIMKGSTADSQPPMIAEKEREIEGVSGILAELEKKLEDLQQVLENPKPLLAEMLKMIASKPPITEKTSPPSLSSSRAGTLVDSGASSGSPTSSTAATGAVTHLGVVGRGLKRASPVPIPAEPPESLKKNKAFESPSAERVDSGLTEDVDSSSITSKKS